MSRGRAAAPPLSAGSSGRPTGQRVGEDAARARFFSAFCCRRTAPNWRAALKRRPFLWKCIGDDHSASNIAAAFHRGGRRRTRAQLETTALRCLRTPIKRHRPAPPPAARLAGSSRRFEVEQDLVCLDLAPLARAATRPATTLSDASTLPAGAGRRLLRKNTFPSLPLLILNQRKPGSDRGRLNG